MFQPSAIQWNLGENLVWLLLQASDNGTMASYPSLEASL
jgi:hypothetical protein